MCSLLPKFYTPHGEKRDQVRSLLPKFYTICLKKRMTHFCNKILYPSRWKKRSGVISVTKILYPLPQKIMIHFCTEILYPSRQKRRSAVFSVTEIIYPLPRKKNDVFLYQNPIPLTVKKEIECILCYQNSMSLTSKESDVFLYRNSIPLTEKKRSGVMTYLFIEILYTLPWKKETDVSFCNFSICVIEKRLGLEKQIFETDVLTDI